MGNEGMSSTGLRSRGAQQLLALPQKEMIRHPCDVIADDSMAGLALSQICVVLGHPFGVFEKETELIIQSGDGALSFIGNRGIGIYPRHQEPLQTGVFAGRIR